MDASTLRSTGGLAFVRERAAHVDAGVRAFMDEVPAASEGAVAVLAVGGYGRRELFPGSDVDLVVLHEESSHRLAERVAEAVLYPLWDLGLATGNAVRTIAECDAAGGSDPRALTALMDARLVGGRPDLLAELNVTMDRGCLRDPARLVEVLDGAREERRRRFGRLAHATEPDLKEPLGGLRDLAVPAWLARAGLPPQEVPHEVRRGGRDASRRARGAAAVHRHAGQPARGGRARAGRGGARPRGRRRVGGTRRPDPRRPVGGPDRRRPGGGAAHRRAPGGRPGTGYPRGTRDGPRRRARVRPAGGEAGRPRRRPGGRRGRGARDRDRGRARCDGGGAPGVALAARPSAAGPLPPVPGRRAPAADGRRSRRRGSRGRRPLGVAARGPVARRGEGRPWFARRSGRGGGGADTRSPGRPGRRARRRPVPGPRAPAAGRYRHAPRHRRGGGGAARRPRRR